MSSATLVTDIQRPTITTAAITTTGTVATTTTTSATTTTTPTTCATSKPGSCLGRIGRLVALFFAGMIFGFASEKARVFEPKHIRLQLVFENWIMMKVFLGAMGTGTLCLGLLSVVPLESVRKRMSVALGGCGAVWEGKNVLGVGVGATLLGIGMAIAGSCPGMVLPQVGAAAGQAMVTLCGGLLAALFYGLLHDRVYEKLFPSKRLSLPPRLPEVMGIKFAYLAFPMSVVVCGMVVALEILVPWRTEVSYAQFTSVYSLSNSSSVLSSQVSSSIFHAIAWPPWICGVLLGMLQVLVVLCASDVLGGSSAYCTIVSQLLFVKELQTLFPYLAQFRMGIANWWQVIYMGGAVLGGVLSSSLSSTFHEVPGVPLPAAFIGGFLMVLGARLSSGCTSGHGLSGVGLMYFASFVAVCCMFGGGISTAFILKATGQLENLALII